MSSCRSAPRRRACTSHPTTSRWTDVTEIERTDSSSAVDWRYAPAPESRSIVSFRDRYGLFIGGESVEPRSGEWFATISPATEEPLAEVAQAGPEDVAAAVAAAREGFGRWSALRPA